MFAKFLVLCLASIVMADVKQYTDNNLDLYKYDASDVYTLPKDIDDHHPNVHYTGNLMKARTEKLESFSGRDKYKLDLRTDNGIQVSSVGKLKDDKKTFVVSGSYSFTGANGQRFRTRYTADEFGYHPVTELENLPKLQAPPVINAVKSSEKTGQKKGFQFLKQILSDDKKPSRGSGQSGDDYSYAPKKQEEENDSYAPKKQEEKYESHQDSGYDYSRPAIAFDTPSKPDRQYLPAAKY